MSFYTKKHVLAFYSHRNTYFISSEITTTVSVASREFRPRVTSDLTNSWWSGTLRGWSGGGNVMANLQSWRFKLDLWFTQRTCNRPTNKSFRKLLVTAGIVPVLRLVESWILRCWGESGLVPVRSTRKDLYYGTWTKEIREMEIAIFRRMLPINALNELIIDTGSFRI